jgi:hypothetical protein
MDKLRIDLGSSNFEHFIKDDLLYIDKTLFIEHFVEDLNTVLLVTRPRRMGKSLNMNMLARYLDVKRDTGGLFMGLRIAGRPCFERHLNRYPVVYMDFRFLRAEDYPKALRELIIHHVDKYLSEEQYTKDVRAFTNDPADTNPRNLFYLTQNLHKVYNEPAVILIDEYDHALQDNAGKPEYAAIRDYISAVFEVSLKGNEHLMKALLTGVLRVSQESMFSKLNNVKVYDVFTPGPFDEDFGLTEAEVRPYVPEEHFQKVKDWYNNVHIGNSWLFYPFSVFSYLESGKISDHWGSSGSLQTLGKLLTPTRAARLSEAVKRLGSTFVAEVDPRVSLEAFYANRFDKYYYAVAVQGGYLTYEADGPDETLPRKYRLRVPNEELLHVWRSYILSEIVNDPENRLGKIFAEIGDVEKFSEALSDFISHKLSHFDIEKDALEKTYHVFIFGMMLTLGYECSSNREAGDGRYDLFVKAPEWTAAIEFKVAKSAWRLKGAAREGLKQIRDKKYLAEAPGDRPAYAIGVGCFGKECLVVTERTLPGEFRG